MDMLFLLMAAGCANPAIEGNTANKDTVVGLVDESDYVTPILEKDTFLVYVVDPKEQKLKMYWKDDWNTAFGSIQNLKNYLEAKNEKLVFAMNGGMYMENNRPLGLFIKDGKTLVPINRKSATNANFYLKPNGIFSIDTLHVATICKTEDFVPGKKIKYATQSGPMLIIDGEMHPAFKQGSNSVTIRNGVGILPDNRVLFVMAAVEVNFYDFANYFKKMGCKNALFLDGGISCTYLPEKNWEDLAGNFGAIIALSNK